MAFNINFRGLISHIEDSGEARVLLVRAGGHRPLMIVHVDDVAGKIIGWPDNPLGVFHVLDISSELMLTQAKIDLAVPPTRSPEFKDHVPSLKILLDQDLDPDAKKGKVTHGAVAASLRYGSGTLTSTMCFSVAALWSGTGVKLPECVAKEVRYIANPDGGVKVHDSGDVHSITIRENATIWITNSDKGNQFKEFAMLGQGNGATLVRVPSEDSAACVNCKRVAIAPSISIECGNTSYP